MTTTTMLMRNLLRRHHQSHHTLQHRRHRRAPSRDVHIFSRQFIPINHTPLQQQQQQQQVVETDVEQTSQQHQQHIVRGQQLLLQAGFIRQSSSGIFHHLPLATRVMEKIMRIIDDELQTIGCQKLSMPIMLESELWKRTGRWESTGEELVRIKDRRGHDFCLAPTHEEAITNLVANNLTSHRLFPLRLYQIGTKFRDEMRPRYGLMRCKEFVMKDAYTFDRTQEDAFSTYDDMVRAYRNIFDRMGLRHVVVEADSGNIGGSRSHEFQVPSAVGEDTIIHCSCGRYAANVEKAAGATSPAATWEIGTLKTSLDVVIQCLSKLDDAPLQPRIYKFTLSDPDTNTSDRVGYAVLGGERVLNPTKIKQHVSGGMGSVESHSQMMTVQDLISELSHGDLSEQEPLVLLDHTVREVFYEAQKRTETSESSSTTFNLYLNDFREAQQGDYCVKWTEGGEYLQTCQRDELSVNQGIEVGHVFYLGTKYSKQLDATFTDNDHQVKPIEMGCFGIGVSRVMQAIVETSNDKDGIIWPSSVAPFKACVIPMAVSKPKNMSEEEYTVLKQSTYDTALQFAEDLETKIVGFRNDVMFDDRLRERPPVKLKDASLLGYPYVIVFGKSFVSDGTVELQVRKTGEKMHLKPGDVMDFIRNQQE